MKGFLAVSAVLLVFDGAVIAGGGLARMSETKTALIASSIVVCGAMFGCDRGQQMAGNMVAPVRPPAQSQSADERQIGNIANSIQFGLIHEEQFPQIVRSTAIVSLEVNNAGGIAGGFLEAVQHKIYRNDRAAVVESANNLAVRDDVYAIIGPSGSVLAEFSDEVAQIRGVPMMAIGATNPGVTRAGDMVFLTAFSDTYQGQMLARFAHEDLEAKSAAVLFWNESDYSREIARAFYERFINLGGDVGYLSWHSYTYSGDDDLASRLDQQGIIGAIAAAQPDVVVIPSYISDSAVVMRVLRSAGVRGVFLGADSWGGGLVDSKDEHDLVVAAGDAVEGAYFASHFSADANLSPEAKQFVDFYISSTGGIAPDALAALSYDAMRLTALAAERVGGDLTKEKLRDEIAATINYRGATNIARYNERREPIKNVFMFNVRNGDKVFHKTIEPN